ncbi:glycosyltransferase family 4 protein [Chloroflexota bacterium]
MILFVQPHFTYPGGGGKVVLEIGERLAQMGLEVGVLALSADRDVIAPYPRIEFLIMPAPLPGKISHWLSFPALMRNMEKMLAEIKIDVLFPHVFPANYWGFLYKRRHREIPCLWFCHEPSAFVHNLNIIRGLAGPIKYAALLANPFLQIADRKLAGYADRILVNSRYTAKQVERIYGQPATVVYPGVATGEFRPSGQKKDYIFTIGRLTRFKRIDLIFRALALLKGDGKEVKLVIGGDGEDKQRLIQTAGIMGLENQVSFTGRIADERVRELLAGARAVIFPTTNEPFGIVPLEAMACGTPVIVSNSGGPMETVIDGQTGLLFHPDDAADLARKIDIMVGEREKASEMAAAARQHVSDNFSWEQAAEQTYGIIKDLTG